MFGLTPQPTPFDLHWRMFGIDVRVHPFFWLMSVMLGWSTFERGGFPLLLAWVLCVFVSILVHELGHVVMGRVFGSYGHILLYSFGGLAINASDERTARWQRILISFAGPFAGFILLAIVLAVAMVIPSRHLWTGNHRTMPMDEAVFDMLIFINLWWGLLNLLPIFPLDGGQISRAVFEGLLGDRGAKVSLGISCGLAGILAVDMLLNQYGKGFIPYLRFGDWYTAIFFALLAVSSYQMLQVEMKRSRWRDDERLPWE